MSRADTPGGDDGADGAGRGRSGFVIDPVGLLVGLVLPVAVLAGVVIYAILNADALPEQYPSHWGASGEVDGWSDPATAVGVPLGIGFVVALPMTGLAAFARIDVFIRQMLLTIGLGVMALIAALTAGPLVRVVGGETDPGINGPLMASAVVVAVGIGAVAALRLRDGRPVVEARSRPDPALPRAPLDDSTVDVPQPRWVKWLLGGTLVAVVVGMGFVDPWMALAIGLLIAPTLVLSRPFRVRAGAGGLVVGLGTFGITVQRVAAAELEWASTEQLDPSKHGGVGYRFTGNGVAVLKSKGPGVRVQKADGRHLLFGCPDEETATRMAGVLNSAADARARG